MTDPAPPVTAASGADRHRHRHAPSCCPRCAAGEVFHAGGTCGGAGCDPAASGADQPTLRDRYWQCDDTCTVDCGACKGQGRPTLRDQLAALTLAHRHVGSNLNGSISCACGWSGPWLSQHQADALLPVVERVKAEAAAEALEKAADDCEAHGSSWRQTLARNSAPFAYARWLRARAAALRSNAGGDR